MISIGVAVESVTRLYTPVAIQYREAFLVAVLGLVVNIVSAVMLKDDHSGHDHAADPHDQQHQDHNLRAAYVHVIADAATSVLAIAALGLGATFGLRALDPIVGLLGAAVIARWSIQLVQQTSLVLLDVEDDPELAKGIRTTLNRLRPSGRLHCGVLARAIVDCRVTDNPDAAFDRKIKAVLRARHGGSSHVTIEVEVRGLRPSTCVARGDCAR